MKRRLIAIALGVVLVLVSAAAYVLWPAPLLPAREIVIDGAAWRLFNPAVATERVTGNAVILTLTRRALWAGNGHGALLYRDVSGNFRATAMVRARRATAPDQPVQSPVSLGGLAARNPLGADQGAAENYVHIVTGNTPNGIGVEVKTTQNGATLYETQPGTSADAQLRLCRIGATFYLLQRAGTQGNWQQLKAYERPDLPPVLMVGATIYAALPPDLQVTYEDLRVEPVNTENDCKAQ